MEELTSHRPNDERRKGFFIKNKNKNKKLMWVFKAKGTHGGKQDPKAIRFGVIGV